ncbi:MULTISPECIES: tagatose 1,6-diphosphate aldolase [unclassified Lactobacillus]|uniref:tagatose 1,6-diphosphate aldolase n=1 Tax=unclassified Lactobacillus TaxID=2620435 RepID=UPI000EFAEEA7|nr:MULTISPECIES: tagatose 1,6-diphosphate aldolase [unclassified Lactobacillus]RMC41279.1 tagatose 1,6-diphosphate aldolase [Lactobacillus sp. ESL0237]RMC45148.1 tagatose 1,6-diphosphate aldolase [Lactobacillus sp. ESL0234]RMC45980.1 tagatose 1,6-diphosphate aldolase [Lactobacillus sp. ESL0236]RMC47067.1 tagatose 1,6-diphosphate aldolase [Lactobacillus sp. ESL0230]RMC51661.1 tagatose 1,6-diphosphate aldolase [Lactobacillus sp. ESL0225]
MRTITSTVAKHMENLSTEDGIISALAIDQRGSLKTMLADAANKPADETTIVDFKKAVSSELTPYASSILTDPEYGLPATKVRDKNCGLLLSYEKTGYDTTVPGRMPDLIENQSGLRIKNEGGDAIKFLVYYDPDEGEEINDKKKAFVERVGAESKANELPFFLEILTYDAKINDTKGEDFAKVKANKVIATMQEFSKPQYNVTVLKVEIPFNLKYVEGFNGDNNVIYTQAEAKKLLKKQSEATDLPYIFLSAGVTSEEFIAEIKMAEDVGAKFNGVLCGRATWKPAIKPFAGESEEAGRKWLATKGKENIENLNKVLSGAKSWREKLKIE